MRRSEAAVGQCVALWRRRAGLADGGPIAEVAAGLTPSDVERVVHGPAVVSDAWCALEPGGSLLFDWPRAATIDPAGSRRGRRVSGSRRARRRCPVPR